MKQSNLKGGNAAVRFLLAHGEKFGIAAIGTCALLLIWSAINVPRLENEKNPEALKAKATSARNKIESFTWEGLAAEENPSGEPSIIVKSDPLDVDPTLEIPAKAFPIISSVNPHVVPPQSPRTDPVLLAAEDLEVYADMGLWVEANPEKIKQAQLDALREAQEERMEDERRESRDRDEGEYGGEGGRGRGGRGREDRDDEERRRGGAIVVQPGTGVALQGFETIRAESWVTVLAKIPIEDQFKQYEDALQQARGYDLNRDRPVYLGYMIQRSEVTAEGQGEWKLIGRVNKTQLEKELATYPVNPPEVVDSRYVHPLLTHPLPPLILKEWDNRASHSSIPLASEATPKVEELQPTEEKPAEDGEPEDETGFAVRTPQPGQMPGEMMEGRGGYGEMDRGGGYRRGGYGEFAGRGGGYEGDYGGGRGGYGRGEMDGGGYGRGYTQGEGAGFQLAEFTWDEKTSHVLLRFFDSSVEPGHRYRYRVKLALLDVNNGVPLSMLDKSVTARRDELDKNTRTYRLTEWSKQSPIASVPPPARLYVMSAEPAKASSVNSQPEAEVLIKALDSNHAAEIALTESFTRGSVMNVQDRPKVVWSNEYEVEKDPEFNFFTGATLVDVRGGEKLSSKNNNLLEPARAVVMDAGGKLTIHRELKDATVVKEFQDIVESPPDARGGYGRGGGEMEGGRGGRGRGGRGRGF